MPDEVVNDDAQDVQDESVEAVVEDTTKKRGADETSEPSYDYDDAEGDEVPSEDDAGDTDAEDSAEQETREEAKSETVEFDAEILDIAKKFGMDEKEARSYGSVRELEVALNKRAEEYEAEKRAEDGKFKVELSEDDYDPELVKIIHGMNDHYAKEVAELRRQNEEMQTDKKAREIEAYVTRFDGYVDKLGSEFESVLGKGSSHDLTANSPEVKKRLEIHEEMETMKAGYQARGKTPPSEAELFNRAAQAVIGDEIKKVTRKAVEKSVKKKAGQILGRPTGKQGKNATNPLAAAVERERRFRAEHGDVMPEVEDYELAGL